MNGSPLDQYNSYRPETAVNLAALILSGNEYDLEDFGKDVIQLTDFLRIEIRNPENAYYIYQYENRYFVTKPGDYTSELTQDAYDQIRSIYLSVVNDHEVRTGGGGQSSLTVDLAITSRRRREVLSAAYFPLSQSYSCHQGMIA